MLSFYIRVLINTKKMSWIISYLIALLLLVFDLICVHTSNRIGCIGKIILFFIPIVNIVVETVILIIVMCKVGAEDDDVLNDNKITRWLFNEVDDSVFYQN